MGRLISLRRKFLLALTLAISSSFVLASCIILFHMNQLSRQLNRLADERREKVDAILLQNAKDTKKRLTDFYSSSLRKKAETLIKKDADIVKKYYRENQAEDLKHFLIGAIEKDPTIISASFVVADFSGVDVWFFGNREFPQGLGLKTKYSKKSESWSSNISGKAISLADPNFNDTLNLQGQSLREIQWDGAAGPFFAFEAAAPILEDDTQDITRFPNSGETLGFLRYIMSPEGLQTALAEEEVTLQKQITEYDSSHAVLAGKIRQASMDAMLQTITLLLLSLGLFALAAFGTAFIFGGQASKDLKRMVQRIGKIKEGQYKQEKTLKRTDEIGLLSEAIESLQASLARDQHVRHLFYYHSLYQIRHPLTKVKETLDSICQNKQNEVSRATKEQLFIASQLIEALNAHTHIILDLAQNRRGFSYLKRGIISLAELKHDIDAQAMTLIARYGNVEYSSCEDATLEGKNFIGDRDRIFTMIANVLDNAFKFADSQRPNRVHVEMVKTDRRLVVRITDEGIGISEDFHKKLFEEFRRANNDLYLETESRGLGLPMVKSLAGLMNAEIKLSSNPSQGTTFTLIIPEQCQTQMERLSA